MDTRIPLMGQPIDFVGSMTRGIGAAQLQNQANRENALAALYQKQGPQIASGDPGALNALAALDPSAALGVQQTRQGMAGDAERLRLAREAGQREAQRMAAQATAEQVAAEAEKGRNLILQGTAMYEAWTAGDQGAGLALNAMLQQHGIQGNAQSFPQIMAVTAGALDTFSALQGMRPKGPTIRAATPQEAAQYGAAGGQIDESTGRFTPINPPSGMSVTTADGTVIRQGPGAAQGLTTSNLTDAQKSKMAFDSLMNSLDAYGKTFDKGGNAVLPGVTKDSLDAQRRGIQLQMKELFNLGVLNGPDLALMDQMLVDPTSIQNYALDATGIASTQDRVQSNLAQVRQILQTMVAPKLAAMAGQATQPAAPAPGVTPEQTALPPPPAGIDPSIWQDVWDKLSPEDQKALQ